MTNLALPADLSPYAQAELVLLKSNGLTIDSVLRVLHDIHQHEVDLADLYFQHGRLESWSLEEGIVKAGSFNIDQGVGVRAVSGEKTAFAYSDEINLTALDAAARAVRTIGRQGQSAVADMTRNVPGHALYTVRDPLPLMNDPAKVALLERIES